MAIKKMFEAVGATAVLALMAALLMTSGAEASQNSTEGPPATTTATTDGNGWGH